MASLIILPLTGFPSALYISWKCVDTSIRNLEIGQVRELVSVTSLFLSYLLAPK